MFLPHIHLVLTSSALKKAEKMWELNCADLAHLVERHLAKVEVASSSLVIRSKKTNLAILQDWSFFNLLVFNTTSCYHSNSHGGVDL